MDCAPSGDSMSAGGFSGSIFSFLLSTEESVEGVCWRAYTTVHGLALARLRPQVSTTVKLTSHSNSRAAQAGGSWSTHTVQDKLVEEPMRYRHGRVAQHPRKCCVIRDTVRKMTEGSMGVAGSPRQRTTCKYLVSNTNSTWTKPPGTHDATPHRSSASTRLWMSQQWQRQRPRRCRRCTQPWECFIPIRRVRQQRSDAKQVTGSMNENKVEQ